MRACGEDVREVLHDGHPTACLGDAAFGYVNVFKDHLNVGFFRGVELADPKGTLEGTGKYMRHVKVRAGGQVNAPALTRLITAAYADMSKRLQPEGTKGCCANYRHKPPNLRLAALLTPRAVYHC